jgi:hypothetical protein
MLSHLPNLADLKPPIYDVEIWRPALKSKLPLTVLDPSEPAEEQKHITSSHAVIIQVDLSLASLPEERPPIWKPV